MSAKWVDPTKLTLEELAKLATALLKPDEGKVVAIVLLDAEDAERASAVEPEPVPEEVSNVVAIFPSMWTPSEYQTEQQEATRFVLQTIEKEVQAGKLRECIVILGVESNEERLHDAVVWMTTGVTNDLAMFLGGMAQAKDRLLKLADDEAEGMEVFDED